MNEKKHVFTPLTLILAVIFAVATTLETDVEPLAKIWVFLGALVFNILVIAGTIFAYGMFWQSVKGDRIGENIVGFSGSCAVLIGLFGGHIAQDFITETTPLFAWAETWSITLLAVSIEIGLVLSIPFLLMTLLTRFIVQGRKEKSLK